MKTFLIFLLIYFRPLFEGGEGATGGEGGEGGEGGDTAGEQAGSDGETEFNELTGNREMKEKFDLSNAFNENKPEEKPEEKPEPEKKEETQEHAVFQMVKENFKDHEFTDDNSKMDKVKEMIDDLMAKNKKFVDENAKVIQLVQDNDDLYKVMADMFKGATFSEALASHIDVESIVPNKEDPDYSKYEQRKMEREAKKKELDQFDSKYNENQILTKTNIKEFAEENKLSEEKANEVLTGFQQFLNDAFEGLVSKSTLNMFLGMMNLEAEKQKIAEDAELKAKNEKSEIEQRKIAEKGKGDNLPDLAGGGKPGEPEGIPSFFGDHIDKKERERKRLFGDK